MLTAKEVAEYFICIVDPDSGDSLSNLKIQKLLYYAQGFALAIFRGQIFSERIMRWALGPVVEEVYHEYKKFGNGPVPLPDDFDLHKYDAATRGLLDEVFEVYGQFSASALVEMTHNEPPWKAAKDNKEISVHLMQEYFSKQIN